MPTSLSDVAKVQRIVSLITTSFIQDIAYHLVNLPLYK